MVCFLSLIHKTASTLIVPECLWRVQQFSNVVEFNKRQLFDDVANYVAANDVYIEQLISPIR